MMQICLFYHPEYTCVSAQHVCAQAEHYAGEMQLIQPKLFAARLPTHHCSTHVQLQTPQGKGGKKKIIILLGGQPHSLTSAAYIKQFTHLE